MPLPGLITSTITSPIASASTVVTSKYSSARRPMRPTCFIAPICEMPTTTVVNTIGAISILTSLMNPSPSGFMAAARGGSRNPNRAPIAIAVSTCT